MYKKGIISLVAATMFLVSGCQSEEKADSKTVETEKGSNQGTTDTSGINTTQDSNKATDSNTGETSNVEGSAHASDVHKNSNQQNSSSSSTTSNNVSVTKDTAALVMADYVNGLTTAINTGDFSNVAGTLKGSLYNDQQSLVKNLYKKGIKENWVSYSVVGFNKEGTSSDGPLYKIQTVETVSVIQPDESQKTNKYNWMYTAVLINNQLYLTDIAKNGPITTVSKTGPTNASSISNSTTTSSSSANSSTKAKYLSILEQTRAHEEQPVNDQFDADRRQASGNNYYMWDKVLNDIYGELKNQLSTSEMNDLKIKQRQWIKDRDAAAEKDLIEAGGGTLAYAEKARILHEMTRERCYFLFNNYMK
ncbi:lysozyme inhibitor LprI family protein [Priestia megaterium]|uniref:lysozyme inhibitor LprI family protein n=1 Tax=Priestia megaterium TaxID=1404 RepID=UPI0025A47684|nr:lysozyme inhibitor LprI family protein [Priestia megaterium]MDM8148512.1 lysozyme inhibitor LprI family protein [Priestia megaterium]